MTGIKAVETPTADPKTGKSRPTSGVKFPYYDLEDAVAIATAIHERAGGLCDRAQLAALLGHKGVKSGAFLSRIAGAKMFGVIEQTSDWQFRLSKRGQAIAAPISEAAAIHAKVEAFLDVDLFKKVFDRFHGTTLPNQVGLQNLLQMTYEVVGSRVVPTIRIMLDSADYAGLFAAAGDRTRMVKPLSGAEGMQQQSPPPGTLANTQSSNGGGGGTNGGGGGDGTDVGSIDPAILGLLRRLPPGGTPLSGKRRKALVEAFTATVNFIYPESDGDE